MKVVAADEHDSVRDRPVWHGVTRDAAARHVHGVGWVIHRSQLGVWRSHSDQSRHSTIAPASATSSATHHDPPPSAATPLLSYTTVTPIPLSLHEMHAERKACMCVDVGGIGNQRHTGKASKRHRAHTSTAGNIR